MGSRTQTEVSEQYIDPRRVYSQRAFCAVSGINYARVRTAVREGVRFPAYNVGRLKYIDGDAAIEFIHALRDLHTKKQVEKNAVEQA